MLRHLRKLVPFGQRLVSREGRRKSDRRRPACHGFRPRLECLESRVVPTLPPPNPIAPTLGEANLLATVQNLANKQNLNAQDHYPVPFVIVASAGGAAPTVMNWKAGAPIRIDADRSLTTGYGGNDIQVTVNTDLLPDLNWQLRLDVVRLDGTPFAQDLKLVIAFPFDAFNTETNLPGAPHLFFGYQTRLPGAAGDIDGEPGGIAPAMVQMRFTPGVLAGTAHTWQLDVDTTGASNPLTFLAGHVDGDNVNGLFNAAGLSAYVRDVPASIDMQLRVNETLLHTPSTDSFFDLTWNASSASLVTFDYLETESEPVAADFHTSLVVSQMPTSEHLMLDLDEGAGTLMLHHRASAVIDEATLLHQRADGLVVTGVATNMPTEMDMTLGLAGSLSYDANDDTLDLLLQTSQAGGFDNTGGFLGYNLGYLAVDVTDAPDLTAAYDGNAKTFTLQTTDATTPIPYFEFILDDNGLIGASNVPTGLELPPSYNDSPAHNLWSLIDDGTHGTAMARLVSARSAMFDHDAPEIRETLSMDLAQAGPMQVYLRTGPESNILPFDPVPSGPNPYVELTTDIDVVPAGPALIVLDFPATFSVTAATGIQSLSVLGHIGTLEVEASFGDLPAVWSLDFRPDGSLAVVAEDALGNPEDIGHVAFRLSDPSGFDPGIIPLPEGLGQFFPVALKDARLRVDDIPTFNATWDNTPASTFVDFNTAAAAGAPFRYVGGVQFAVGTEIGLPALAEATPQSGHYASLKDTSSGKQVVAGIFGIDSFRFESIDYPETGRPSEFMVDWVIDPARPLTPFDLTIDSNAAGVFFGGHDIFGQLGDSKGLHISEVPSELHFASDLDPEVCTGGFLPIPFLAFDFSNSGTTIQVNAFNLPANFCLGWEVMGDDTTFTIGAENFFGSPDRVGRLDVLFSNPSGLPGSSGLFGVPLTQLRARMDDIPTTAITVATAGGGTHVNIDTAADGPGPFSLLGAFRLSANTTGGIGPFGAPMPGEDHYLRLTDAGPGGAKAIEAGFFDIDELDFRTDNASGNMVLHYDGVAGRRFTTRIDSHDGKFFPGHDVIAALVMDTLPGHITMTIATQSTGLAYTADAGIGQIKLAGPALLGLPGDSFGTFNTLAPAEDLLFDLEINSLPSEFSYQFAPGGSLDLTANGTVDNLLAHLRSSTGIGGSAGFLGQPIQEARVRLDGIPSLSIDWSDDGAGTAVTIDTTAPGTFLDGAQLALSTAMDLDEIDPATSGSDHYLEMTDEGGANPKRLHAGLFGLDLFSYTANDAAQTMDVTVGADTARRFEIDVNSASGGVFFGGQETAIDFNFNDLPDHIVLHVDFDPVISYTASQGIADIDLIADLGSTHLNVDADDLPAVFSLAFDPESSLSLVAQDMMGGSDPVGRIVARMENETGLAGTDALFGVPLQQMRFRLDSIPSFNATWSDGANGTSIDFNTAANDVYLGGVQLAVSTDTDLAPLPAPADDHYLRITDEGAGGVKQFKAGFFGIDQFTYSTTEGGGARTINMLLDMDMARRLVFEIESAFGGRFFPDYAIHAMSGPGLPASLMVENVPAHWQLSTNLATAFSYSTPFSTSGIDAIVLAATVDDTNDGSQNGTEVSFMLTGLPSELSFTMTPGSGATLVMDGALDRIDLTLSSDNEIFGSDFQLFDATVENIPGRLTLNWGGDDFLFETTDPSGNPAPLGRVTAEVSTSNDPTVNAGKVQPYTLDGPIDTGAILSGTAGGSRINYSPFLQEIDRRYYNSSGAPSIFSRLRDIYAGSEQLDPGEDHIIARLDGSAIDYARLQLTGFQKILTDPDGDGGSFELRAPTPGTHPLFVGFEMPGSLLGEYTTLQIQDVPDSIVADLDLDDHFTYDADASAGEIDLYSGPLPKAADNQDALRAVLKNTPRFVHLNWNFDLGLEDTDILTFDASNEFELLYLFQDSGLNKRFVGGLRMEDLQVGYDIDLFSFDVADRWKFCVSDVIDIGPLPDVCSPSIPVAWDIVRATAGIDNDAGNHNIGANFGKPGVDGFIAIYDRISDPGSLINPSGPAPGSREYVPLVTGMMKDFRELSLSAAVTLDPFDPDLVFPFGLDFDATLRGDFMLDFWSSEDINETFGIEVELDFGELGSVEIIDLEVGIRNRPDYRDNTPIHLFPFEEIDFENLGSAVYTFHGFHGYGDHFDPYSALVGPGSGEGHGTMSAPLTPDLLAPVVAEAFVRWENAGADLDHLASLRGVTIEVADLPGTDLASAAGGMLRIDRDAAGIGWFVDPTPGADEEFSGAADSPAQGRMDLLTVVIHELGHLLGHDHSDEEGDVMAAVLQPGIRLVPAASIPAHEEDAVAGPVVPPTPLPTRAMGVASGFLSALDLAPVDLLAADMWGETPVAEMVAEPADALVPQALLDRYFQQLPGPAFADSPVGLFDKCLTGCLTVAGVAGGGDPDPLDKPLDAEPWEVVL
jgi:hypothetical protein